MLCDWGVKADMVLFAGNTVWSISERVRGVCVDALYKSTFTLLYFLHLYMIISLISQTPCCLIFVLFMYCAFLCMYTVYFNEAEFVSKYILFFINFQPKFQASRLLMSVLSSRCSLIHSVKSVSFFFCLFVCHIYGYCHQGRSCCIIL